MKCKLCEYEGKFGVINSDGIFCCECAPRETNKIDNINNPPHYKSGMAKCPGCQQEIECIDITRWMSFTLGNAIKYIWRCEHKGNKREDIKKAIWYLQYELDKEKA